MVVAVLIVGLVAVLTVLIPSSSVAGWSCDNHHAIVVVVVVVVVVVAAADVAKLLA